MTVQIAILGLGQIGSSIGLALGEHKDLVQRTGNDADSGTARRAEKLGAIDHIVYNLPSAVRRAELVILAMPVDEIRGVLEVIAQDLKEDAVVIDTSHSKEMVAQWVSELLPPGRHFVSWTPSISPAYLNEGVFGIDGAHADLFRNSLIFITCPSGTDAAAIKLATDLTTLVGGKPFFADQAEVDGLLAANTILPQLSAAALVVAVMGQPGWSEGRKLAGSAFAMGTSPVLSLAGEKSLAQSALVNRENVIRVINNYMVSLNKIRSALQENDSSTLHQLLSQAVTDRDEWTQQRLKNDWMSIDSPQTPLPTAGEVLGRLVSFGKSRSAPPKKRNK